MQHLSGDRDCSARGVAAAATTSLLRAAAAGNLRSSRCSDLSQTIPDYTDRRTSVTVQRTADVVASLAMLFVGKQTGSAPIQTAVVGGHCHCRRTSCVLFVISAIVGWSTATARDFRHDGNTVYLGGGVA